MAVASVARVGTYGGGDPGKPVYVDLIQFLGDAAYPTNGTLTISTTILAATGMVGKTVISIKHVFSSTVKYILEWDRANDALRVVDVNTGAEVGNGTNLAGTTFEVEVVTV